ncbi:hypothetical protein DFJ73DRAFT_850252 [Zopfochytrium polystomum]|nr:hypothetical protein DFJ73DRAFT_850252 [Zopfochytrium polystomum]
MATAQTDAIPTQCAETILNTVNSHASEETKLHAMYTYHFLGYSIREIAQIYGKSPSTILEWIRTFDKSGNLAQKQRETVSRKFTAHQVEWIMQFLNEKPLSFLDEAKSSFKSFWGRDISITSIWRIIHDAGLTWKRSIFHAAERQSLKIQEDDIFRFVLELNSLDWTPSNLLFLDEVGFSNGDLVQKRFVHEVNTIVLHKFPSFAFLTSMA